MSERAFRPGDRVMWRGVVMLSDGSTTVARFEGYVLDVMDESGAALVRFAAFEKRLTFTREEAAAELQHITRDRGELR